MNGEQEQEQEHRIGEHDTEDWELRRWIGKSHVDGWLDRVMNGLVVRLLKWWITCLSVVDLFLCYKMWLL